MKLSSFLVVLVSLWAAAPAMALRAGAVSGSDLTSSAEDYVENEDVVLLGSTTTTTSDNEHYLGVGGDDGDNDTKLGKRGKGKKDPADDEEDVHGRSFTHVMVDEIKVVVEGYKDFSDLTLEEVMFINDAVMYSFDIASGDSGYKSVFSAIDYAESRPIHFPKGEAPPPPPDFLMMETTAADNNNNHLDEEQRKLYEYDYFWGTYDMMFTGRCRLCPEGSWVRVQLFVLRFL